MNKLREKFDAIIPMYVACEDSDVDQLEQITDDFSIAFAEWCDFNATQKSKGLWFSVHLNIKIKNAKSTTELLNYFKENVYGKE